jgi:hypothetical protein
VVVDAERASPELVAYIADLPLKEEATSGRRTLYRVVPESAR